MNKLLIFILFSISSCGILPFDSTKQKWEEGYLGWVKDNTKSETKKNLQ